MSTFYSYKIFTACMSTNTKYLQRLCLQNFASTTSIYWKKGRKCAWLGLSPHPLIHTYNPFSNPNIQNHSKKLTNSISCNYPSITPVLPVCTRRCIWSACKTQHAKGWVRYSVRKTMNVVLSWVSFIFITIANNGDIYIYFFHIT